jgi:thermitase
MMINKAIKLVLSLLAALLLILSSGVFAYHYEKDTIAGSEIAQIEIAVPSTPPGQSVSNPDEYVDKQWALSKIRALGAWQVTSGSQDILVAVLDTGIDRNHEDLDGQIIAEANFTDDSSSNDLHGHGTHVAGIIAAKKNGTGIVGVAPESRLMNAKIADNGGRCQASALAEGIVWAVDGGADVINISVEIREPSPQLEEAVNYAWSQGSLIVVAAGNDGNESPVYPAYYENCIAVAATNQDDHLALLSNHGDWVDVAAPGWDIYSTLSDNGYGYKSGTSFACPYVSGMAALLFNVVTDTNGNGRLNDEVRAAIEAGCQEIDATGVGRGRIDVAKAVAKVNCGS